MGEIVVRPLDADAVPEAVDVLARAFVDNPLHVAAFGPDVLSRNVAFFRTALSAMPGARWAAYDGDRLVGVAHWVASPGCQTPLAVRLQLLPGLVGGVGFRGAMRLLHWLSAWADEEPESPHVHLGPIGVLPAWQGRGVGAQLMTTYCAELDGMGRGGYLETDRPANVAFYRRFAFEIVREREVIGVTNYLMERPPLAAPAV